MGTSVNQRSPDTDNWRVVQDIYVDPSVGMDDALKMLWRAASNPNETNLFESLSRPEVGQISQCALQETPIAAMNAARQFIADAKVASFACDIATRAAAQSVGQKDAVGVFAERLFAEATSYLVARDLPGYVGVSERLKSVVEARAFVAEISGRAAAAARSTALPERLDGDTWRGYVRSVVLTLRGAR